MSVSQRHPLWVSGISTLLVASLWMGMSVSAMAGPPKPTPKPYIPAAPKERVLDHQDVTSSTTPVDPTATASPRAAVAWPRAARSRVQVPAGTLSRQGGGAVPLQVQPSRASGKLRNVDVSVVDRAQALAAGVDGLLFTVAADSAASWVVRANYAAIRGAGGAQWAQRLRLVRMPACAVTTPSVASCRVQTALATSNDTTTATLTAKIDTPQTPTAAPVPGANTSTTSGATMVVAAVAGAAGSNTDFSATGLSASGSWSQGGSTGGFGWTYPIDVPDPGTGDAPDLGLDYNSQAVDGQNSTTNNQSGWVGEGFDHAAAYVERTYRTCADDLTLPAASKTPDLCWAGQIITVHMPAGPTQSLVRDDTTGTWRSQVDNGNRIELLAGASNGANGGEYWVITTPDGTRYTFGQNVLPGGSAATATNSTWTVPVYGPRSGDPCYNASGFAASSCAQAWRWNLDLVEDTHHNATVYYYKAETNYYGAKNLTTPVKYVRGGYLDHIDYGLNTSVGGLFAAAPNKVTYTVAERCFPAGAITCSDAQFTTANANAWPDTPIDQNCAATGTCNNHAPTFWTRKRLTTITSTYNTGTAYQTVDKWALGQSFHNTGDNELVLDSVTRTGYQGATSLSMPPVTFTYDERANRVAGYNSQPAMLRQRLTNIATETGANIAIAYSGDTGQTGRAPALCTATTVPTSPQANTGECYPVYWTLPYQQNPTLDYFHKYVVTQVTVSDRNATAPTQITTYTYLGGAAWRFDDNEVSRPKNRSYSQFRGYAQVETRTGNPSVNVAGTPDKWTLQRSTYYRGMDGDPLPGGTTRSVSLTDSRSATHPDTDQFAGMELEQQTFNGDGGAQLTTQITVPAVLATTATRNRPGLTPLKATIVRTTSATTYTGTAAGATLTGATTTEYDPTGRPVRVTSSATGAATNCVATSYADNTTLWVHDRATQVTTYAATCPTAQTPSPTILRAQRTYYDDNSTLGQLDVGDPTRTETATSSDGTTLSWAASTTTYDTFGRATSTTVANPGATPASRTTSISYTPAGTGPLTRTVTTLPISSMTSTTLVDPGRGVVTQTTDPAGRITQASYDPLGRRTAVWFPGRVKGTDTANVTYTYLVGPTAPIAVTTKTLVDPGNGATPTYRTNIVISDAFGNPRQGQADGTGGGRIITDIFNDSHGWPAASNDHWTTTGNPAPTLITTATSGVDDRAVTTFDGAGRPTKITRYKGTTTSSVVNTIYGGDRVTVIPPTGGTSATTITNGRGEKIQVDQYTTTPTITGNLVTGGSPNTLTYSYDAIGQLTGRSTAVGTPQQATWSTNYDLAGRPVRQDDPDTGTTQTTYYDTGEVATTTDATQHTLAYTYDALGRRTSTRTGSATGTALDTWTYDTATNGIGQPASQTSIIDSANYTQTYEYDTLGRPTSTDVKLAVPGFNTDYITRQTYTSTGLIATQTLPTSRPTAGVPSTGGASAETLTYTYDNQGNPKSMVGSYAYVADTTYTPYAEPSQYVLGVNNATASITYTRDPQTRRITNTLLAGQSAIPQLDNIAYTYDPSGNQTRNTETQGGGTGAPTRTTCYTYDPLRQLTQAWTATDTCTANPTTNGPATIGGPQPFWLTWTFDPAGNRTNQTNHATTINPTTTSTTYSTTTPGHAHALTTATRTNSTSTTTQYTYNADGSLATNSDPSTTTTYSYGPDGTLASATHSTNGTTRYIRDAAGTILLRQDPTSTTLYLPMQDITRDNTTGLITPIRNYTFNGQQVSTRTGINDPQYLLSDLNHTNQLSVAPTTWTTTRRYLDPYGNPLTPTTLPGNRTYLNQPNNPTTGLIDLGARHYDPTTGRFTTVDPLITPDNPQQNNGYTYANNNPITYTDPNGLMPLMMSPDGPRLAMTPSQATQKTKEDNEKAYATLTTYGSSASIGSGAASSGGGNSATTGGGSTASGSGFKQGFVKGAGAGVTDVLNGLNPTTIAHNIKNLVLHPPKPWDFVKSMILGSIHWEDLKGGWNAFSDGNDELFGYYVGKLAIELSADLAQRILGAGVSAAITEAVKAAKATKIATATSSAAKGADELTGACRGGLCGIPGKTCFVAGTFIRTERGDIPIEQVKVGDKVWSRNVDTGRDELQPVVDTYVRHAESLLKLTVAGAVLTTTADHPFMAKDRGWVKAGDLTVGDILVTPTGAVALTAMERVARGATVYIFQVATNHDYYALAGATPVLVHNADYGDLISRPGQIADQFGATAREVKDAIHQAKTNLPRGGPVRNPDVSVDPVSGEIYPQLPGGGFGDSIGNMWDLLGKG